MRTTDQKKLFFFLLLLGAAQAVFAHTVNYELANAPVHNIIGFYAGLGIQHIIPNGLDHIVFVIGLCLLSTKFKAILWQATAFTVAHSVTLALSMKGVITLPSSVVEPIIALSILFIAVENILLTELKPWRIAVVFLFGLIHGLGFASALNEIGLPPNQFLLSILSFNLGVEIGQIIVIALVFGLVILPFGKRPLYRKSLVYPLSAIIGVVALWWTIQRL
jgi:hypothetical protein